MMLFAFASRTPACTGTARGSARCPDSDGPGHPRGGWQVRCWPYRDPTLAPARGHQEAAGSLWVAPPALSACIAVSASFVPCPQRPAEDLSQSTLRACELELCL